ncbi:MAG: PTS sugar transporter subunit IIC/EAL domain-containing protein [Lachnospiraceae bacterium]|nr:PTS sugar transporter subunit IIC/EAL domain-containing protein [Lachnospiraceae bacterium]
MKKRGKWAGVFGQIEDITIVRAVRNGLIHITPVLIIGAMALIFMTFPVEAYQQFLATFLDGFLSMFFEIIYGATFGVLSVYMTYSISRSYMRLRGDSNTVNEGAYVASILSFFILAGAYLPDFKIDHMGPKSMFLAIITGLGASYIYLQISRLLQNKSKTLFLIGADREFNRMLLTIFPIVTVTVVFALLNAWIVRIFGVDSFRSLIGILFNKLFSYGDAGFLKGFCFVALSSILWFFGIHGSDTLEGVMQTYFVPGLAQNQAAVAMGSAPSTILTKEFFDCFVLMGGCGATICLLIALLIFSKSRARKGLAFAAAFPMIFNINELMVFGLPIIFNLTMLVPFLITPLVCYTVSYLAIAWGLVPMVTTEVAWTTPILLGGYRATGSMSGAVLQLVNVVIGILLYMPFVRLLDRHALENAKKNYESFITYFKANEKSWSATRLRDLNNVYGDFAKDLCNDLLYDMKRQIVLAYQPQYHYDGHCIGVEALLRWEHPLLGMIYPPLVIKMAEEGGFLAELEERILVKALSDRPKILQRFGKDVKLSVNVTGITVVTPRYIHFCRQLNEKEHFAGKNICMEITEQAAISFTEETLSALSALRKMGILLAIDDFSMGQTSIHYLRESVFDIIKLDGSLVNGLFTYENSRDIIFSLTQLAKSLNLTVLAEYVDSEEKRKVLHEIGCDNYQGYLYSPAVFLHGKS